MHATCHPRWIPVEAIKGRRHRRHILHRARNREGDQVRVRNLLGTPRGLDTLRELAPSLVEHVDPHRAEARCRRDLEALLQVLAQRGSRPPQRNRGDFSYPACGRRWGGGFLLLLLRRSNFPSPAWGGG